MSWHRLTSVSHGTRILKSSRCCSPTLSCTVTADIHRLMINETPAVLKNTMVVNCQAPVLEPRLTFSIRILLYSSALLSSSAPDTRADDQRDTIHITENTMVALVKSSFVKLRSRTYLCTIKLRS